LQYLPAAAKGSGLYTLNMIVLSLAHHTHVRGFGGFVMKKTIAMSLLCLTPRAHTLIVGLSAPAYAKVGPSIASMPAAYLRSAPGGGNYMRAISSPPGKGTKVVHLSTKDGWWRVRTSSGTVDTLYRSYLTAVSSNSNSSTTVSSGNTYNVKVSS
jgi:hypothetical protein